MGLNIPNLDKKDFDIRLQEAIAKLPAYSKEWTEYNLSDPGITIVELLAWLSDINSYKLNRIRKEHEEALLKLLVGIDANKDKEEDDKIDSFSKLEQELLSTYKAVTLKDYENIILENEEIIRAKASVDKKENIVTIIVVPKISSILKDTENIEDEHSEASELLKKLKEHIEPRLLLTTKVKIAYPEYTSVNTNIVIQTQYQDTLVLKNLIISKLQEFFNSTFGIKQRAAWEFGKNIKIPDIYFLLNEIEGIDIIDSISFYTTDVNIKSEEFIIDENSLPKSGIHNVTVKTIPISKECHNE